MNRALAVLLLAGATPALAQVRISSLPAASTLTAPIAVANSPSLARAASTSSGPSPSGPNTCGNSVSGETPGGGAGSAGS